VVDVVKVSVEGVMATENVEDEAATAAVDTMGAAAAVSVETDGGSEDGDVPEDNACPEADDDSTAAAITLIRRLFTGMASISKTAGPLRRGPAFPYMSPN